MRYHCSSVILFFSFPKIIPNIIEQGSPFTALFMFDSA